LHAAASGGHVSIMRSLLDRGLSVSDVDKIGDTPLHWIPGHGSAASVRLLLDRGADVNAENSVRRFSFFVLVGDIKLFLYCLWERTIQVQRWVAGQLYCLIPILFFFVPLLT